MRALGWLRLEEGDQGLMIHSKALQLTGLNQKLKQTAGTPCPLAAERDGSWARPTQVQLFSWSLPWLPTKPLFPERRNSSDLCLPRHQSKQDHHAEMALL